MSLPVLTYYRLKPDGYGAGAVSRLTVFWADGPLDGRVTSSGGVGGERLRSSRRLGRRQIAGCLLRLASSE